MRLDAKCLKEGVYLPSQTSVTRVAFPIFDLAKSQFLERKQIIYLQLVMGGFSAIMSVKLSVQCCALRKSITLDW